MRFLRSIGALFALASLSAVAAFVPALPSAARPVTASTPASVTAPRAAAASRAGPLAQGSGGGTQALTIVDFGFEANPTTVPVGTKITWTNTGERPHTATDRGGTFDTQPIEPGTSASVTLTVPGTYFYFCRINPARMNGTIIVPGDAASSRVVRVQGVDDANIAGEKLRFDPPELTVTAGATLLFANAGGKPHSVTADDGSFTTGIVLPGPEAGRFAGTNATLTLDKPGTFPYHCDIHPQAMKGTLTVTGAPVTAGPAPPSAGARTAAIDLEDFQFKEGQVSVAPGAQLTFTNKGQAPHTATFDDVPLDTGQIGPGDARPLTAPLKPGSYSYKCTVHPARMRGVLVVLGQNTPDPVRNTTTTSSPGGGGQSGGQPQGTAAPVTAVPTPPAGYTSTAGASGAVSVWVIVTAVIAAFLAGMGVTSFLRTSRRDRTSPQA